MRLFVMALVCVALLAGCATAPRNLYAPYKTSFGMYVAHSKVNTFCLSPKLRFAIAAIERGELARGQLPEMMQVDIGAVDMFGQPGQGGAYFGFGIDGKMGQLLGDKPGDVGGRGSGPARAQLSSSGQVFIVGWRSSHA